MPNITFIKKNGEKATIEAQEGMSLLEVARENDIEIDGPCDGALACGACHVIIDKDWIDKIPSASDREEEVLDFAWNVCSSSRLACQIIVTKDLDGLVVKLPGSGCCGGCCSH